jgi:hypothetical protein
VADLLLLAIGAGILAAFQAVGLLLAHLIGEDTREAASYWYALTCWPLWLPAWAWRERRLNRSRVPVEPVECDWFHPGSWSRIRCEDCGRPAWEHKGERGVGDDHREWEPGEADAERAQWTRDA